MSSASHAKLFASLLGDAGTATPAEVAGRAGVTPEAAAETLAALSREGRLEPMPGGGYRASRLDSREVRELYPAVLVLEAVAVRDAPPYDAAAIEGLREANATLEAAADAEAGARGDDLFHEKLTESCGNQRLLDVVRPLRHALMARARAEGKMRQGVTSRDLKVLFAGVTEVLRADGNRDPAEWRRYAGLVADAMRA